ncbi:uncharacterized protein [Drosophila kikkawai]|uniref:Uncharacterized protein isoform X3 n=1 Tax=Drosophila kikkawai TaxID=30033 RepID=A0ABM4G9G5_DROKI|nr:uncharacterized protein LOC108086175 isoform X3 [Drosophila kikkawai]
MSPKYHHFEIALVYFLLLIPWPPTNVLRMLCSRDNSRLVRKIVRSKWTPILDKHQVKLPLECPLHPFRDVFAPRQDAKQRDRPTQWTCRKCGKSFYQEKHLDLHFETRHKSIINEAEDAVCLADFCDIMRCEVFETEDASSLKFGDQHIVTDIEVWGDSLGQNSALAKANAAYLSLIPRTSTLGASRAAKVQNRQLLQDKPSQASSKQDQSPAGERTHPHSHHHHHQNSHHLPRERPSTTANPLRLDATPEDGSAARPKSAGEKLLHKLKELGKAHLKSAAAEPEASRQNETDDDDDEEEEEGSGQAEGSGQSVDQAKMEEGSGTNGNGNKARANCKPEELSKLKTRCELLLRSCIGGLLLSMSDQAFKEMEEEMNKAVCWYLTCDRYWEDGPLEPRAFPWGLIVILIFVLSTGICFCYYIIWILFDHLFQLRRDDNQRQPLLRPGSHRRQRREHLHARSSSGSSLPCGLCHAARPRPGRRRDSCSTAATAAASGAAVLLPATATAAGGLCQGFVSGSGAIPSAQPAALHRRSASGGGCGHTHPRGRAHQLLQRQHAIAPSPAPGSSTPPAASSLDEPGLPTGHFRPTRLYK